MEDDIRIISLTPENISSYGVCGYKDITKHEELRRKIAWYEDYYPKGLRIKALVSEKGGYQGMIEYIPGEYAHRPVDAAGYMFIHCIFTGFKKEYKGKGYGSALINECIKDAESQNMKGVAVVTRKGSFMAKKDIFLKLGFAVADTAKPDFELFVLNFEDNSENGESKSPSEHSVSELPWSKLPKFREGLSEKAAEYPEGLTIIRSPQCPYSVKNVNAIMQTAEEKFGISPVLIDLKSHEEAQQSPCPFGTFCIIYNGKVISHHPISNTRFENIMDKLVK